MVRFPFYFWYMGMIPDLGILRDRAVQRLTKGVYEGSSKLRQAMAQVQIFSGSIFTVY